jgi:hypothetical protein
VHRVIAYVFWHRAAPGSDRYEERLVAFHAALAAHPPAGFRSSRAFRLDRAPWLGGAGTPYEDWYLVESWAALGTLNTAAVSGQRAAPHDAVAALAREGAGGVYAPLHGAEPLAGEVSWLAKPAGMSYADFHAQLAGRPVWQRQMVLGPSPEYLVQDGAVGWPAVTVARDLVC